MKKTTLLDVANHVNVSKTTVSMVLNNKKINVSEETRNKIFKASKELNYIPNSLARTLSTNRSYTIGCVVPDIENPFFSEIAKAIETEAEKYGFSMILCNTLNREDKEENYIKLLISKLVDGVIIVPSKDGTNSLDLLTLNNIPLVVVDRKIKYKDKYNIVHCDNRQGIKLGIKYLIDKSKKNIAFVGGIRHRMDTRLDYFKEFASELRILNEDIIEEENFSMNGGIRATENIIKKDKNVDCIFYSSDVMAIGGIKYLIRNGYNIPEDISILGYDNIHICSFIEPELTTIAQPIYKMGEEAFKLLLKVINSGDYIKENIILEPYLVERETVK
ncbi:LacI family DNA-binding transcriptional regulator [Clostridium taeniosporum]|uniref:LacI family transcriptional regulator n=1 Tax=Clostridium taeniosporum TaxID=394958 RepID=A0A1D7XJ88_9CLOT|nr:LacI family DNA-binding transcriptional regulator [Clostridium taeniosporum]AOR23403.1 LacI family transcriptional regulator [Clostridium taeniosporum]